MKEVTEWNGKPRWMWVWNSAEKYKDKDYVTCILTKEQMNESNARFPVSAVENNYLHCAEIEEYAEEYATEDLPDGYTKINYTKKLIYIDGVKWGYDKGLRELYERVEKDSLVYFGTPTINRLKEIIKGLGVDL